MNTTDFFLIFIVLVGVCGTSFAFGYQHGVRWTLAKLKEINA
jgi:hypothetical protein